jgi:hypothetical protein
MTLASATPPVPTGMVDANATPVTLTSTSALNAINFVVVGLDRSGNPTREVIAGPNNNTVTGHVLFSVITSITPSASNAGTVSAGWPVNVYGPALYTGTQPVSIAARIISGNPTFDVQATDMNIMDPGFFLLDAGINPNAVAGNVGSYANVPASLQTACPDRMGTAQILPEDDGTWSLFKGLGLTFTTATPGATANTADYVRTDPTLAFAIRLMTSAGSGLVQLDIIAQRPW